MADQDRDQDRIKIDTTAAWDRIRTSYTAAAHASLEAKLAGRSDDEKAKLAGRSDDEKARLREAFEKFLARTFEMSHSNLRINGRNFEDILPHETGGTDPFDEGLDRHIWSLSDQSLQWDGEIARKRREKPGEVHRLMRELLETQRVVDEVEAEEWAQVELNGVGGGDEGIDGVEEVVFARTEETVRQTYAVVDELQQSVTTQAERSERLRSVTAEVKALKA